MALVDPDAEQDVLARVEREYLKSFPALEGKYLGTICSSADGVDLSGGITR